jgi:HSP20 family protein
MDRGDSPFGEIEQLFDQLSTFGDPITRGLAVDVLDAGDELVVEADVPGRDPETIDVRLEDNRRLHIEAPSPGESTEGRYVTRERPRESLQRTVRLPAAVDDSGTEASYEEGVLRVRLTKLTGDGDGTEIPVN